MDNPNSVGDLDLAQQICSELNSGHPEAIVALYNRYHNFLAAFAKRRWQNMDQDHVDEVLSNFWIELLKGRAICNFSGRSSLLTYLTGILNRRIIDANRKNIRDGRSHKLIEQAANDSDAGKTSAQTPENLLISKENRRIVHNALKQLEEISPRDAGLIKMQLEGRTYAEMAESELAGKTENSDTLRKKTDAIKKQFTRNHTGSLARFKKILSRNVEKAALEYGDPL